VESACVGKRAHTRKPILHLWKGDLGIRVWEGSEYVWLTVRMGQGKKWRHNGRSRWSFSKRRICSKKKMSKPPRYGIYQQSVGRYGDVWVKTLCFCYRGSALTALIKFF